jgi:hypothetical protein
MLSLFNCFIHLLHLSAFFDSQQVCIALFFVVLVSNTDPHSMMKKSNEDVPWKSHIYSKNDLFL